MHGKNFNSLQLEKLNDLESHKMEHPLFTEPLCGHLFLKDTLNIKGCEIGLHRLEVGKSMPYYHVHNKNEETYIFYQGVGEFMIDKKIIPISNGTIIHVEPKGVRTWRNTGDTTLCWICVQSPVDTEMESLVADGKAFSKEVVWA